MSPRFIVRIVSAIISTPCVVVIYLNIEKWAEANGYDSFLVDWTRHANGTGEPEPVMSVLTSGPMLYGAIAISSLTLGLWIDWVARRFERSKPNKKSTLKSMMDWRGDYRRHTKGKLFVLTAAALPVSRTWKGYWQRSC